MAQVSRQPNQQMQTENNDETLAKQRSRSRKWQRDRTDITSFGTVQYHPTTLAAMTLLVVANCASSKEGVAVVTGSSRRCLAIG